MTANVDPILLEVFKNGFEAIADEMALILMRTAHSPIVRDAMDFSTALCDADGENLAQGLDRAGLAQRIQSPTPCAG